MSYAVIQTGGKQYKVTAGEIIKVEKLADSNPETKVEAELIKNGKERTVLIFKKRRRKNSRRKNGHRQQFSLIRINKIFSKDGKLISEAEKMKKSDVVVKKEAKEDKIEASK